ncbi:response regulator [Achromobacter spanius]|uniref:response regulator n=1 Tax=Achromobacter spanius TaxID=217203 RepID=UPI00381D4841
MFPPRIQLCILDTQPLVLKGLTAMFKGCADVEVAGAFDDSTELLRQLPAMQADVLMMEYFLEGSGNDCAELISELRQRHPRLKIMIFSASQDPAIAALALRLGAHGYVCKSAQETAILHALRRVHHAGRYVDPLLRHLLPDRLLPVHGGAAEPGQSGQSGQSGQRIQSLLDSARLSPSERLVVRKFVAGANVLEIATRLRKSPKTVSTQKAAAFRKLGVSSDSGLFRLVSSAAEPR